MLNYMTVSDHSMNSSNVAKSSSNIDWHEIEHAVGLLRDITIWADLKNEIELRRVVLPSGLRTVHYYDASDDRVIATLTDVSDKPFTAYDLADVLTWHVDHRDQRWAASRIRSDGTDTLELWIDFAEETC